MTAFVVAVIVSIPLLLMAERRSESPPVTEPNPEPRVLVPTTEAPITNVSESANVDETTQALLDEFARVFNSGDVEAFMSLLHPQFQRSVLVERDTRLQPLATVNIRQQIEVALNTEIQLDCAPIDGGAACEPTRTDDLHIVLDHAPTTGWTWYLRFRDGLLVSWSEIRSQMEPSVYANEVITPFVDWVEANRPDVPRLWPGGASRWTAAEGNAELISGLVRDWAASKGISLNTSD